MVDFPGSYETGPRQLIGATIEEYTVGSWCPTNDGTGPATAVAIELAIKTKGGDPLPLIMRLKTPRAVDAMIAALQKHRDDVWPKG